MENNPEAIGYDKAIDNICDNVKKQMALLEKNLRGSGSNVERSVFKYAIDLYKNWIVQLKAAKGKPDVQHFNEEELRAIIDHVTGECQSVNNATMRYFDTHFLPSYKAGELKLKTFTTKPTE